MFCCIEYRNKPGVGRKSKGEKRRRKKPLPKPKLNEPKSQQTVQPTMQPTLRECKSEIVTKVFSYRCKCIEWTCKNCQFVNDIHMTGYLSQLQKKELVNNRCLKCNTDRRNDEKKWNCGTCTLEVEPNVMTCPACGTGKFEWKCTVCTFNNPTDYLCCSICQQPKAKKRKIQVEEAEQNQQEPDSNELEDPFSSQQE